MKNSQTSSAASSSQNAINAQNGNPLSILSLQTIACELLEKADDPDLVRAKAQELMRVAEQAFDVLAFVGSNLEPLGPQPAEGT